MSNAARRTPDRPLDEVVPVEEPRPLLEVLPPRREAQPAPPPDPAPVPQVADRALVQDAQLVPGDRGRRRSLLSLPFAVLEWLFGVPCLIVGLSFLAALPILQFFSLGYLLEAGGRIARTGRFRDGFVGVRKAARVGYIVVGLWLMLLPLRIVSSLARSAELIDPGGPVARRWNLGLTVATVLTVLLVLTVVAGVTWLVVRLSGRRLSYAAVRDWLWDFVALERIWYYTWLGMRGFAGAFLWLAVPISLIALGRILGLPHVLGDPAPGVGFLVGLLGAVLLMVVLLYVPFLQVRFAAQNRFRALFEVGAVRECFSRAPWAFALAFVITLLFALPLYLWKIERIPRELVWLPDLFFIVFIFPTRLLTGWAYCRSLRRPNPRHWFFRWTGWIWMPPVVAFYVLIVFFSQYIACDGILGLYEQHPFLLPVPFFGM